MFCPLSCSLGGPENGQTDGQAMQGSLGQAGWGWEPAQDPMEMPPAPVPPDLAGSIQCRDTDGGTILLLLPPTRAGRVWQVPAGPSEEAGAPQVPRSAQLGSQRPAHAGGGEPHALGSLHGPAQRPVQLLKLIQVQGQAAAVASSVRPGGMLCPPVPPGMLEGDPGHGWG